MLLVHMISSRPLVLTYLLSGRMLHVITVIELLVMIRVVPLLHAMDTITPAGTAFRYYLVSFLVSLPVFSQLDARSRYQNYKQLKDQFILFGFDPRILKPVLKSRCQRDAAEIAARDTGYAGECRMHFRCHGYRWYHLFPDFLFTHPWFLLTPYFWKTTFFTPAYHSRYTSVRHAEISYMIHHQQPGARAENYCN